MREFPKLMCWKTLPDDLVVYFTNPNAGMVVHSNMSEYPLGMIELHWVGDFFEDVREDVIIWLTEGPKEPILEAIEMVEKVKALHLADEPPTQDEAGYDVFS